MTGVDFGLLSIDRQGDAGGNVSLATPQNESQTFNHCQESFYWLGFTQKTIHFAHVLGRCSGVKQDRNKRSDFSNLLGELRAGGFPEHVVRNDKGNRRLLEDSESFGGSGRAQNGIAISFEDRPAPAQVSRIVLDAEDDRIARFDCGIHRNTKMNR